MHYPVLKLSKSFFYDFLLCKNVSIICYICKEEKYVFADSGSFKSANHKKIGFANRKSSRFNIYGRSAILTNYLSPQSCGFAFCGNFWRTAHLRKNAKWKNGQGQRIILYSLNQKSLRKTVIGMNCLLAVWCDIFFCSAVNILYLFIFWSSTQKYCQDTFYFYSLYRY